MNNSEDSQADHETTLLAFVQTVKGQSVLIGRVNVTIAAGELLAIAIDEEGRPVLRSADDAEIDIHGEATQPWGRPRIRAGADDDE